jgi:anti-sigma regulatory factor (Ser/Thr protein kinase)
MVLLPHAPASVGLARRRLGRDLRAHGLPEPAVCDATLVLSELMSNAIRHARPLPGALVQVTWTMNGETMELAVSDGGGLTQPRSAPPSVSSLGGRGLSIVELLARSWGVRRDDPGTTTVWAVLPAGRNGARRPRSGRALSNS